jgi:hypothetical protein
MIFEENCCDYFFLSVSGVFLLRQAFGATLYLAYEENARYKVAFSDEYNKFKSPNLEKK